MLSTRYHITSMMAVFFALGIGILIGGTLGQKWMHDAEDSIVKMLMNKYDHQLSQNEALRQQLGSLQLIYKQFDPLLPNKKILWIRPEAVSNEMVAFVFRAAGVDWQEMNLDARYIHDGIRLSNAVQEADIVLISNAQKQEELMAQLPFWHDQEVDEYRSLPIVLDVSKQLTNWHKPEALVDFIIHLKQLTEDEHHAAADFSHHTGVQ